MSGESGTPTQEEMQKVSVTLDNLARELAGETLIPPIPGTKQYTERIRHLRIASRALSGGGTERGTATALGEVRECVDWALSEIHRYKHVLTTDEVRGISNILIRAQGCLRALSPDAPALSGPEGGQEPAIAAELAVIEGHAADVRDAGWENTADKIDVALDKLRTLYTRASGDDGRRAVIEECAKVCDAQAIKYESKAKRHTFDEAMYYKGMAIASAELSFAIRDLTAMSPPPERAENDD